MNFLNKASRFVIAAIILCSLFILPGQASAANFIVSPANMNGWGFLQETGSTATGSFVTGPGTPPLGTGSARITLGAAADGMLLGAANYLGTPLSDITALSYSTYRTSGGAALAISFQINIDYDVTDADNSWQGRLVFEPYLTGTSPSTGVWETWNGLAASARWWSTGAPGNGACPQAAPCSWADVLTNFPNAGVHPTLGAILFKAGSGWASFDGNVDNLTFGISGVNDTYDFENVAPPIVYVDDDWTGTVPGEDPDGGGPATVYGGDAFDTIQGGADAVASGGLVNVFAGTYPEDIQISKDMTMVGDSPGSTFANPASNTGTSGDARAWWLVDDGIEFHLSNMTLDGSGFLVFTGIRHKGFGSIDNVVFTEIKYNESGPTYAGLAVTARGTGPVHITNSTFTEIGRVGVLYFGAGQSGALYDNNSYTGKGVGDWLDYALDISAGAVVTVSNSAITANRGVASSDGSASACMLVTTYFGPGTQATIANNDLTDCSIAIYEGYDAADTTDVVIKGNQIDNTDYSLVQIGTASTMTAYANNITNFTEVYAVGVFEARRNWWGSHFTQPTGLDNDSWDHRLGAAVQSWSEGSGSTTLTDLGNGGTAQLSGGSGTAVIVSHGRPATVAEAPFGNGISGYYDQMCSDFYDMFLLTGAGGTWTASVPVDAIPACTPTLNNEVIFWIPWGTDYSVECAPSTNSNCWDQIDPVDVVINGGNLDVQNLTVTELSGTPFVAGNDTLTDPTAITLSNFSTGPYQSTWLFFLAVVVMAGASVWILAAQRKQN